jgi:hypothetical protein
MSDTTSDHSISPPTGILQDLVDIEVLADQLDRKPITILRWMKGPDGLPFVQLGNRRLIHIPTAHAWLLSKMEQKNPRRDRKSKKSKEAA